MALRQSTAELDEGEPRVVREHLTAADYFALPESSQPQNLIEGRLYVSPSPLWKHQKVVLALAVVFDDYAREHGGEVILSPMDCELADGSVLQPDVGYVAPGRLDIIGDHVQGAPDLVIEVLSRGTRRFDRTKKLRIYGKNGVAEAWVVDPEAESVTVFYGNGEGWAEERSVLFGEVLPSRVVTVGDANLASLRSEDA